MAAEESNLRPVLLGTGLRDLPRSPVSVPHVPILVGKFHLVSGRTCLRGRSEICIAAVKRIEVLWNLSSVLK